MGFLNEAGLRKVLMDLALWLNGKFATKAQGMKADNALPATSQAVDSAKLGGQLPAYYMPVNYHMGQWQQIPAAQLRQVGNVLSQSEIDDHVQVWYNRERKKIICYMDDVSINVAYFTSANRTLPFLGIINLRSLRDMMTNERGPCRAGMPVTAFISSDFGGAVAEFTIPPSGDVIMITVNPMGYFSHGVEEWATSMVHQTQFAKIGPGFEMTWYHLA